MYRKILIFLAICFVYCESKRILAIYPTPSVSHQVVFRPLMIELAKRGHEVTVITPDPAFPKGQAPPNLIEIDLHDVSYGLWKKFMENRAGRTDHIIEHTQATYEVFRVVFEEQMKSPEIQALLGNTSIQFDLLFTESIYRPSLGFSHVYKVPVIEFSSFGGQHGGFESIGAVTHPILYPISAQQRVHNLTFWERVSELFKKFYIDYEYYKLEESENKMLRRVFGSCIPDLNELRRNVKMLFLNVHPLWDLNRPTPPSVLYLGGLHKKPQAELPQDIKSYLDTSKNGVIYVSFGTNMRPSLFPKDKLKVFTKVFSELPYDILWKWDVLDYPDCPKNVKISTWFPQSDLLRHPKIKLFITQAGLQSTDEAITAGVPLIGLPMLWDQWFNVELYEIHDIGIKINFETLTEDKLKNAISNILGDQRYKNNIEKLRNIINDQLQSPMERAVWWTEHVLRTGGDHLRTPAANMRLTEYYQLDIILFCAGVAFFSSMLLVLIVCLGKFHSVWVCGNEDNGEIWCAGQPARAGGPHTTALRPVPLKLPEPCLQVALTLTSTIFLLQSGAVIQYTLNNTENPSPSSVKSPTTIKLASVKPLIKISHPLGIRAGRSHGVVWNKTAVYTWGTNLGQLGHSQEDKIVQAPKRVGMSLNNKEESYIQLVDATDAATVITTSRGDVYLLHKYLCKKIAIKQINLKQVCVEAKVNEQGSYSRVTVLLLTNVGQLMLWQDTINKLTRCVFGLNHQIIITHVTLTHDALYFTTKQGDAFIGCISRKTTIQPIRKEKERERDNKSALVRFLEKDDCTSVRITRIPNVHRAVAISVDSEGLNFACLQMKPTCGLTSLPDLSPSCLSKHMEALFETAAEDDILHDVIFKVGLKHYPAHIFIIASSSDYLYKLYQESNTNTHKPTIVLDNVHPEVFERILKYMYTGTCDVAELGPCGLKVRREDLTSGKKENVDTEEYIENPSEISAFEVYKNQDKKKNRRRNTETPPRVHLYCDPIKLVQATAKRLHVMGLHKLLDKFYYRDGTVCLKESATYTKNILTWDRNTYPELVDTNVCSKDGMLISAHKCVLAARLEYFYGMFMHSWTESKLLSKVTLPINHGILLPVINFLYTDTCPEIQNSDSIDFICSMLVVSDQLFISRLREMCEISLSNLITLKNCTEICQFAHTYNASQLKQCCMEYISLNIASILENRSLDHLEGALLEDITKYYCKFNPIMSSRVITPFFNSPSDETVQECTKNLTVDLEIIDEDFKKDDSIEITKKKKQKKIEYTESEKARMRYESVSSVTSLDLSHDTSGGVTLSLSAIPKSAEKKSRETEKWTEVPTSQQKQQKVVQARLKAISSAKDILNETPANSFTKLTKNNSFNAISQEPVAPTTSRQMSTSPKETEFCWGQSNMIISHVGPKLSQKQRKKLASETEQNPQTLDNYLSNKLNIGSPTDKPKNPWKICEVPIAQSSPNKQNAMEFNKILADQKKQKDDFSRIMTKPLNLTQLEDKAIEELERFYNAHEADDELITVRRIELQVASPQWIHTAPK